ncbi:MAG: phage major capsid protein [Rhodospirillaceae bacterium]
MTDLTAIAAATAAAVDSRFAALHASTGGDPAPFVAARDDVLGFIGRSLDLAAADDETSEPDEAEAKARLEVKFDASTATIIGYASVFGSVPDSGNDIVSPGAFSCADQPQMLREHKTGAVVGRWSSVSEDEIGLKVVGSVSDASTIADLRSGKLDGLSIGYVATKSRKDKSGRRLLDKVNLREISLVKRPMNNRTRVLSVKSAPAAKENSMLDYESAGTADDSTTETKSVDIAAALAAVTTRLDKLETVSRRPGAAGGVETKSADLETKAFAGFIRHGRESLDYHEVKSLRVSDDTAGGYLAPEQFVNELLRNLVLVSPVRSIARVSTTSAGNVILPKRTSTLTASWVGETDTRAASQAAYGQAQYPVAELACYTDVSNSLLEDAAFDIASELAFDFSEQFGKTEGAAFVNGDGVLKPRGFMTDTSITSVNSGDAAKITADSLLSLYHALPTFYSANAVWGMNRTTLGAIRTLKDKNDRYILSFDGMPNAPAMTILGRPVVELPDMQDVAGGTYPVIFGDFMQGYRIFDRVSLAVLRDPYSVQTSGQVRFHARRRVAGGVSKSEAFRTLKISA